MRCEQIRDLLSSFMDEMCSEKENIAIKAHLKDCVECRKELEEIQGLCLLLRKTGEIEAPESFMPDFHKRLLHEKVKLYNNKGLKTPRKTGWIAASVASVALMIGIYASSFIPFGQIIASWPADESGKDKTAGVVIEDIISRVKENWDKDKMQNPEQEIDVEMQIAEVPNLDEPESTEEINKEENIEVAEENIVEPKVVKSQSVEDKESDLLHLKIKVEDINSSMQKVRQVAESYAGSYNVSMADGAVMQAFSDVRVKAVSIKVPKQNLEQVKKQLEALGDSNPAAYSKIVFTDDYQQAVDKINQIEADIKSINQKSNKSAEDEAKLAKYEEELQKQKQQVIQIEKEITNVTMEIYLMEDIQP